MRPGFRCCFHMVTNEDMTLLFSGVATVVPGYHDCVLNVRYARVGLENSLLNEKKIRRKAFITCAESHTSPQEWWYRD